MKSLFRLKSFSFLLLSVLMLASLPTYANSAVSSHSTVQVSNANICAHVAKQKTGKRGLFSKMKNFVKKANKIFKRLYGDYGGIAILFALLVGALLVGLIVLLF